MLGWHVGGCLVWLLLILTFVRPSTGDSSGLGSVNGAAQALSLFGRRRVLGAVSASGDSVALCRVEEVDEVVKDGAEKKKQSRVLVEGSEEGDAVVQLSPRCALALSGWKADRRFLVEQVKSAISAHQARTGTQPPIEEVSHIIADLLHRMAINKMLRPLVVSCLLGGVDEWGLAQLYKIGTDGSVERSRAATSAYSGASGLGEGQGLALGKSLSRDEEVAVAAMQSCLEGGEGAEEETVAEALKGTKGLRLSPSSLLVLRATVNSK